MNIKLCTETFDSTNPASLKTYLDHDGYSAWKKILKNKISKSAVINKIKDSGLKGKGGAGFLTGLKWSFIPISDSDKYLVCNSDESEPGTCKDRDILRYNPHSVIEGMLIACYAIGASIGYNYLRGEFIDEQWKVFNEALAEAYKMELLGDNIFASGISINIHALIGAGAYIVGEETAMLESIEGRRGMVRTKPPLPAIEGLFGTPTVINNVLTIASVPSILARGSSAYAALGTDASHGTQGFQLSGNVARGGIVESAFGTCENSPPIQAVQVRPSHRSRVPEFQIRSNRL